MLREVASPSEEEFICACQRLRQAKWQRRITGIGTGVCASVVQILGQPELTTATVTAGGGLYSAAKLTSTQAQTVINRYYSHHPVKASDDILRAHGLPLPDWNPYA